MEKMYVSHILENYTKALQAFACLVFAFVPEYSFLTGARESIQGSVWPGVQSCVISGHFETPQYYTVTQMSMGVDLP